MGKKKDELAEELMDDLLVENQEDDCDFSVVGDEFEYEIYPELSMDDGKEGEEKKAEPPVADDCDQDEDLTSKTEGIHKVEKKETLSRESGVGDVDYEKELEPKDKTEKIDISSFSNTNNEGAGAVAGFSTAFSVVESNLAHSENLKIAQQKIYELERELEQLRIENEELASAAETFKNKVDKLQKKSDDAEMKFDDLQDSVKDEKGLLLHSLGEKEREVDELKQNILELETRLQTSLKKVRVRERELENRLELVKMEGMALLRSKDEMILDLKRQIDHINMELDNSRLKSQEVSKQLTQKQEILKRTVKALRLALSMLEMDEIKGHPLKKVD